jgi:hypothetical protein
MYHQIPTQNIKFEKFIETLMGSNLTKDEIAEEIILYNSALETNYNAKAREMRSRVLKERNKRINAEAKSINQVSSKNELEAIFLECIEEVRK